MKAAAARSALGPRRWWAGRTLRTRLVAGLLLLLVVTGVIVGVSTTIALRGALVEQLDRQLADAASRLVSAAEHRGEEEAEGSDEPLFEDGGLRGQAIGTFSVWVRDGRYTDPTVIQEAGGQVIAADVTLTSADVDQLATLRPGQAETLDLSGLGEYRLAVTPLDDGDSLLVAGLPTAEVRATVRQLELIDGIVFAGALAAAGLVGAAWVGLTLRPLRRVAATATSVTELPLASGKVSLPPGVPDDDPHTEVGQVGAALNHMLAHVSDALARRQATEEQLRRFIADASHELRTPLAAVAGHAQLARLASPDSTPDLEHALDRIDAESARMSALVDDLLLLARLDAGRPLAAEPVDLCRLAIDATSDARVAGPRHRWRLDLPDEPVVIVGDPHRLHQVLANLLSNARAHCPPGTTVTVRVAATPDGAPTGAEVSVTDDGPGIPPDVRPTIFERFVRADPARSRSSGGTGLGLAIVAAVVAAHHGTVTVDSRLGHTQFRVVLPAGGPPPSAGQRLDGLVEGPDADDAQSGMAGRRDFVGRDEKP